MSHYRHPELGSGNVYTPHEVPVYHFGNIPLPTKKKKKKKKKKRKKEKPVPTHVIEHDPVAHPSHYTKGKIEVIDFIEHMDFSRGSIVKYVARAGHKPGGSELEDLKKAQWLLDREIERIVNGA